MIVTATRAETRDAVSRVQTMRLHSSLEYTEEIDTETCESIVKCVLDALDIDIQ